MAGPESSIEGLVNGQEGAKRKQRRLTVMTYNLFLRPPLIQNPGVSDFKDRRLELFLEQLRVNEFDVVVLQEVFGTGTGRRQRLLSVAKEAGYKYTVTGPKRRIWAGRLLDGGLVLLSRYPIVAQDEIVFSTGVYSDGMVAKGVLYAAVSLPHFTARKEKLHGKTSAAPSAVSEQPCIAHVFTTHLQAAYTRDPDAITKDIQLKQLKEMVRFIDLKTNGRNEPVIVAGDFNVDAIHCPSHYASMSAILSCAPATPTTRRTSVSSCEFQPQSPLRLPPVEGAFFDIIRDAWEGLHPPTTVPYVWHRATGDEVRVGTYLRPMSSPTHGGENEHWEREPLRLDYIFFRPGSPLQEVQDVRLEAFMTQGSEPFDQLSDHLAVIATFGD